MNPIRLFIIDDQPVSVLGLRNMFRTDRAGISIYGNLRCVDHLVESVKTSEIDILMIEPNITNIDPLLAIAKLHSHYPSKPVIIFTSDKSSESYQRMLMAGVNGYLLKTAKKDEIKLTIEKVLNGQFLFSFFFNRDEISKTCRRLPKDLSQISLEEQKIMMLLAHGNNQREIANKLSLSVSAIEKNLRTLRNRYMAGNNVELFRLLIENNIV